ncbi:sorting nexin-24-like protein [Dinothrombium tinctorium]|uniref:Sorting nexin-24-like protein n=1 Tax=Dinothrombium tinctorium TaxID=1965070 RepID=A0A3S3QFF0_9ACAR|nr:sorting nexin-24-like protein [Dinothrombium tinctorium]RWS08155.1 sorting nexin-24-like protein [Dinothrombium tinctorium]RWS16767.1 sorting nexin-24-like protein [Dinothrombium tinctorium]
MVRVLIPSFFKNETKKGHSFTVYCVEVYYNGKCHKVQRRYRDFYHLHREMKKLYKTPEFPPKKVRNLNQKLIEQRRLALEKYLQAFIKNDFMPKEVIDFLCLPNENYEAKELRHQSVIAFTTDYRDRSPSHSGSSSSSSLPDIVVKGTLDGFYSMNDDDFYCKL